MFSLHEFHDVSRLNQLKFVIKTKRDKNFKSFFFPYLIKRSLIQQLDNHYHRNCITGIISKN